MARSRRSIALALSAVTAVVLCSCGVPTNDGPQALPDKGVPFGLLSPSTTAPSTTLAPGPSLATPITVYFVSGTSGHLVGIVRHVPFPGTVQERVAALLQGPTNAETTFGITTSITTSTPTRVLNVSTEGATITVNLTSEFAQLTGPELISAVAQIVYTVTEVPSVTGVLFEISGQPVSVPVASGTLASSPVNRSAYSSLAPTG